MASRKNVEEIDVEVDEASSKSWHVMGSLVSAVVQDGYIVAPNASDEDERVRLLSCPLTHLHFSTECVSPCPEAMSLFLPGKSAPQAGRFSFRWEEYLATLSRHRDPRWRISSFRRSRQMKLHIR